MTAVTATESLLPSPDAHPAPAPARRRRASRSRRCCSATSIVVRKTLEGVHPADHPPAVPARVRVRLRVPEDRAGHRWRQRGRRERVLDRARRRASSVSRSCSRASSRSRSRWCRSSGTRARSKTACRRRCRCRWSRSRRRSPGALNGLFAAMLVFPIAAIVPATPVHLHVNWLDAAHDRAARLLHVRRARPHVRHPLRAADGADAVRHLRAADHVPRRGVLPLVVARAGRWLQILVLANPLVYMCEGLPRRAHDRART